MKPSEEGMLVGRMLRPIHTHLYKRAAAVIAVSEGVANDLESILEVPRRLLFVINNPLSDEILQGSRDRSPPHPWFQEEQIPVLLAVGRLVAEKDYPTLLRAVSMIRKRRPVRLIVLGQGALLEELVQLSSVLGVAEDVDFVGWTPHPAPYMRWCTIFVLSSQREGLPSALLEALGSGTPAVATNCHAGPSEMIVSGEDGILTPVADPKAMAESIELLLDNAELRLTLGSNARKRARVYSVRDIVAAYERILLGEVN